MRPERTVIDVGRETSDRAVRVEIKVIYSENADDFDAEDRAAAEATMAFHAFKRALNEHRAAKVKRVLSGRV